MAADDTRCPIPSHDHGAPDVFLNVRGDESVASSWGVGTQRALLYECPETGLRFRSVGEREDLERFYGADYHDHMVGDADAERTHAYELENRERIRHLKRYCSSGRVLDVGCSSGLLAKQLLNAGYDVLASDISEYACEQAAAHLGPERVRRANVEDLADEFDGAFDAITLMDVIEHFADVVPPLRAMHRMLRPGGVLFLRTPTLSSPFYRVADLSYRLTAGRYKNAVLKIYHAEHIYFFNEQSIARLLRDIGFEVVDISADPLLWENFRTAEMRHGRLVNWVLGAVYFAGRALGRGHGMRVVARRL